MMEVIDNHSVYLPALTKGYVLDVGCRGFAFAKEMAKRGHSVIAMDPAPDIQDPGIPGVAYWRTAVAAVQGTYWLTDFADKEANRLVQDVRDVPVVPSPVEVVRIRSVMLSADVAWWDAVKLNCEGAEYDILRSWEGPIANQIVVSFHEHVCARGDAAVQAIVDHLSQWYTPVRHVKDARYCAGENWWDSVFVLKELVQ